MNEHSLRRGIPASAGIPLPAALILCGTLLASAVRGLSNPTFGPLPELPALGLIKFLDPLILVLVGLLAVFVELRRERRSWPAWRVVWLALTVIVTVSGVVSAVYWRVHAYDAIQSILFVTRPAWSLLVITAFPWTSRRRWPFAVVTAFAAVNVALVAWEWMQVQGGGGPTPDAIAGLFHDAHQQATFSYTCALVCIGLAAAARTAEERFAWGAAMAASALAGFASQAQKSTGIELAVVAGVLILLTLRSRRRLRIVVRSAPVVVVALVLFMAVSSGAGLWTRLSEITTGNLMNRLDEGRYRGAAALRDLGAVQMAADFWTMSGTRVAVVFLGAGPANFGSPAALRRVAQGTADAAIRELFWREAVEEVELVNTGELRLLGLSAKTSLFGIVLGETGVIALLAFLPLLIGPLLIRPAADSGERRTLMWIKVAYAGVVVQSVVNTLGAWDNDVVLTLLFIGFAATLAGPASTDTES